VAVAAVFGEPLLTLVYTAEHAAYADVFVVVMLAGALTYMTWFFTNIITAARYFRPQVPIAVSASLTTLVACLWWVPEHGILGAAWAWVLAQSVQLAWGLGLTVVAVMRTPSPPSPSQPPPPPA
jgi:O-antigen/teichoic acid export membrane protein